MTEDGVEYTSFTIISIDSLLAYVNIYYRQVYLENCVYKIVDKKMTNYVDDMLFETEEYQFLINMSYKQHI